MTSSDAAVERAGLIEDLGVVGALAAPFVGLLGEPAVLVEVVLEPVEEREAPAGVLAAR